MSLLSDLLKRGDLYLEKKSKTERLVLMLLPAVLIGYLMWMLIEPSAKTAYNKSIADKKYLLKKLQEEKGYLLTITKNGDRDYLIKDLDKKINSIQKRSDHYRRMIARLDRGLHKLSGLLYNNKSWSVFLDSISERAHMNNVEIYSMTNNAVEDNSSFGHVLEVGLRCQGHFSGIVSFMHELEQSTLVTDIYRSSIYTEENSTLVNAEINISVWGIKDI